MKETERQKKEAVIKGIEWTNVLSSVSIAYLYNLVLILPQRSALETAHLFGD